MQRLAKSFLFQLNALLATCNEPRTNRVLQSEALPITEEELSLLLED